MGYYKVPQDVEAEDKLLGPFTFKQFIFIIVTIVTAFVAFQLTVVNFFIALPLYPLVFVFAILGFYRPKDQPVENKVIAYLNFTFKPRKRTWSRDGLVEHVRIKVPKRIEKHRTDDRTQAQVRSQLKQLAQVVDTRGWSTKRSELQLPGHNVLDTDDRLIHPSEVTTIYDTPSGVEAQDDIYDSQTNEVNQNFAQKTAESEEQARQNMIEQLRKQAAEVKQNAEHKKKTKKAVEEAQASAQTKPTFDYINPYQQTGEAPAQPSVAAENPELKQRLKELEQQTESKISTIAERAAELTIDHATGSSNGATELQIEH